MSKEVKNHGSTVRMMLLDGELLWRSPLLIPSGSLKYLR